MFVSRTISIEVQTLAFANVGCVLLRFTGLNAKKHHCLISVRKLTDYEVILEPPFLWNVFLWNEVIIEKTVPENLQNSCLCYKIEDIVFTMSLSLLYVLIMPCCSLFALDSYNRLSPSVHRFVSLLYMVITQSVNTVCDYFTSSTNPHLSTPRLIHGGQTVTRFR